MYKHHAAVVLILTDTKAKVSTPCGLVAKGAAVNCEKGLWRNGSASAAESAKGRRFQSD